MNYFISPTLGVPPVLVTSLRELDFRFMLLQQGERNPIKSKLGLGLDFLKDSFAVLRQVRSLRNAGVVVVNSYVALTVLLLHRLGIIRYQKLIYFGFFLHAPRYFPLFRWLFRGVFTEQDTLLVFSKHELLLYQQALGLTPSQVTYAPLPYQINDNLVVTTELVKRLPEQYYFAGGYTNRDYAVLVEAFRNRMEHLVICGSSLNHDLPTGNVPANVTIFRDLPRIPFKELVAHAQACLLPIKDDTGAAGQSFVLEAMAYQKIVIATKTNVLSELIETEKTGFLLTDMKKQLPRLLNSFRLSGYDLETMGRNAYQKLVDEYSEKAFAGALEEAILSKKNYQLEKK